MVGRINACCSFGRGQLFAYAIGCWLSFVPSTRADGPILIPPAPPAVDRSAIPAPTIEPIAEPPVDGPVLPYSSVAAPTITGSPSLDDSADQPALPILKTPSTVSPKLPVSISESPDDESEFVTVRSRKRTSGFSGNPPRLNPTRETDRIIPAGESPTDPYPIGEVNVGARPSLAPVPSGYDAPKSITPAEFNRLIETMVHTAVPSRHTDDNQWGKKKTVTSGVKVGLKGFFLRANRTTKEVDHGTWKKFEIDRKSGAKPYTVKVSKLEMINQHQFQFSADYLVPLNTQAHLRDFSRGIRLRGMTVDGQAIVQLTVDCTVDFESVAGETPGDQRNVVLYPVVNSAKLTLAEFKPSGSSRLKGSTARELGRDTQAIVEQQIKKRQPGLTEALNEQLIPHGYQLPLNDVLNTKWGRMLAGSTDLDENRASLTDR